MAEMLAVIAIIGILAVAAAPVFTGMMRDRRSNRAATQLVDYYRVGRTRALGRGIPVLVSWDGGGGHKLNGLGGLITMQEPVVTSVTAATSCATTLWVAPTINAQAPGLTQEVNRFDVGNGLYDYTAVEYFDDTQGPRAAAELCFSPTGRTFVRYTLGAGAFVPFLRAAELRVTNTTTGLARKVCLVPNGAARLCL